MVSKKTARPESQPHEKSSQPAAARFENPIISVSMDKGVICSRLESFWVTQTCKSEERAS